MAEVVCVTNRVRQEDPFNLLYSRLGDEFDTKLVCLDPQETKAEVVKDVLDIANLKPKVVVTDLPEVLALSKQCKTILYINSADGRPWSEQNNTLRRYMQSKPEVDIFCPSVYLARLLFANYQLKAKIQYPYIPEQIGFSESIDIVYNEYNGVVAHLENELPEEQFRLYENFLDFNTAKLYVHISGFGEAYNIRIPMASSLGVPCVVLAQGCLPEMTSRGDILIPPEASLKQWAQGVKTAMRDHDVNCKFAKDGSKKFSNLDALAAKVKLAAQKRADKKATQVTDPGEAKRKFLAERAAQAVKRQVVRKPPTPPRPAGPPSVVVSKEQYVRPTAAEMQVPGWFREVPSGTDVDVSIIIPMYRSSHELGEQIAKWDLSEDGLVKEIIYVDDSCPQDSHDAVVASWERRRPVQPIGRIVLFDRNAGFATACNNGALHARGNYLIFLNADTVVTPNWVKPMYDLLEEDSSIGIVGNLQLKTGDVIDSAGSEWMWDNRMFEHIGRNVYRGKRLTRIMTLKEAPGDLLEPAERDMVTGCCMMMRKSLFDEIGGFDVSYRVGYWEDSDLNMEVKHRNYKVYYQPASVIYHRSGHSRAGLHPFIMDNAKLFYQKWVDNFRIDELVKNKRPPCPT